MNFQDLAHQIKTRRSKFPSEFLKEAISKEQIESILDLANFAPTHKLVEPYGFRVFTTASLPKALEIIEPKLEHLPPFKKQKTLTKINQSGALIFIIQKIDDQVPDWENVSSVAMAVQNVWLGLSAAGYGCYWSTPAWTTELNTELGLAANQKCLGLLYVGKVAAATDEAHPKRTALDIVWMD